VGGDLFQSTGQLLVAGRTCRGAERSWTRPFDGEESRNSHLSRIGGESRTGRSAQGRLPDGRAIADDGLVMTQVNSGKPRIGIVIGSTRPGRRGAAVGQWVLANAAGRGDAEYALVDLADFDLPLLDVEKLPGAAKLQYDRPATQAWSERIRGFDGYVFVTPEYNHGVSAAMKNAVDVLYPEWRHKTVGFVGYGWDGAVRAVEHWRGIASAVFLTAVRSQVALTFPADWREDEFSPSERRTSELSTVLRQVVEMTEALRSLR
jgi:NAD(P)H-dependent FMN reductase